MSAYRFALAQFEILRVHCLAVSHRIDPTATLRNYYKLMNPNTDSLYGGIAGVRLCVERFDLGEGLTLKRAASKFTAPFLMESPNDSATAHHGIMSAVNGGIALKIQVELCVPASFHINGFFDRLNTLWWICALIRLRGAHRAQMPVISDRPFAEVADNWRAAEALAVEVLPRRLPTSENVEELSLEDLEWLKSIWLSGGKLMDASSTFNDAFQAQDSAGNLPTKSVATMVIWGALEYLFSPGKDAIRFRVAANIATFLEDAGHERLKLQKQIMKLYDVRSSIAHGVKTPSNEAWIQTLSLAHRVVNKILNDNHVPTKEDLELALFAPGA